MNRFKLTAALRTLFAVAFFAALVARSGGTAFFNSGSDGSDPAGDAIPVPADALAYAEEDLFAASSDTPQLSIGFSQGALAIAWPLDAADWVLEQSSYVDSSASWIRVPPSSYQINLSHLSVNLPASPGNLFFRLRKLNSAAPAVPGLTAEWTLDEGQGQTAQDSSGYGNVANLANVDWTAGRIGSGALHFNGLPAGSGGNRAWVSNANYTVLPSQGQPFSFSLWFSPDVLTNGWRGLIGNNTNGSNGWNLALHTSGPGTNELVFASAGAGSLSVTGRKLLLPGRWYQLTATYDGSEGIIYVDSELIGRGTGTLLANNQPIYFGGGVGAYDSFPGRIDAVRTYTNALSFESVSLAGQWHFDENGGTFLADASVHRHSATASNPTAWAPGRDGAAIDLNNSTITVPNDDADVLPPTGGSFSLSFWLYPDSLPSGWNGLMTCADGSNTGWNLALYTESPGQTWLHFESTNCGGTLDLYAPVDLPEALWSKLDLTFNGGIATLYVNGRKVKSDSGGIQGNTTALTVGAAPGMANFNGLIDELNIYSRERDEAEIGPVAKVMWETVIINSATNLQLQGFGPTGKPLIYSIVDTITPTNGTVGISPASGIATYTAGPNKGPDAFTYTVSDGEFTSPPTIVAMSLVQPHWLSPTGGSTPPLDGSTTDHAWVAGPAEALDAIWHTNTYYDCFFYAPGEYQTTGAHILKRSTAGLGCKHIGSGRDAPAQTTIKLVNSWESWNEGFIFEHLSGTYTVDFEVHNMVLDCNAANNPKYAQGEPVWITIPLSSTSRVDSVTLHWDHSLFNGTWRFGSAQNFSLCSVATNGYMTNCSTLSSTGLVDTISVGMTADEIILRLERRASGVDFYGLAEIEVAGGTVSLPTATVPGGGKSDLDPGTGGYSILRAVDESDTTAWASGPEDQVRIELPLQPDAIVSQVNFAWNCKTVDGVGRFGPAAEYQIQARDPNTGQFFDVPFVREQRTTTGLQANKFGTAIVTDRLVILLTSKELGVDFYSLKELRVQNGGAPVALRIPRALNSFSWGDYQLLRAFDGDSFTQWASDTQGMVGAIAMVGRNVKFTHLRIVGFGTKAAKECFPMFITAPPLDYPPGLLAGNALIEDCIFTKPAIGNTDGLTTLTLQGPAPHLLTNAVVRGCTIAGVKSYFRYSTAFSAIHVENCLVDDCQSGVYFEPNPSWGDNFGPVLVRSNRFLNVQSGVDLTFAAGAKFDSLTCLKNEVVLAGTAGWGFAALDTLSPGPSGSTTNITLLNNIVRYSDWLPHATLVDGGLYCSDIHNAVFGNNVVLLGTAGALRLRSCPSGFIPTPTVVESCDFPILPPPPGPTNPPCLNTLPSGYRRAWFNNRDLSANLLNVKYQTSNGDGLASQQQWP